MKTIARKQCEKLLLQFTKEIKIMTDKLQFRYDHYEAGETIWKESFWGKRYWKNSKKLAEKLAEKLKHYDALINNFELFVDEFHEENKKRLN